MSSVQKKTYIFTCVLFLRPASTSGEKGDKDINAKSCPFNRGCVLLESAVSEVSKVTRDPNTCGVGISEEGGICADANSAMP